MNDYIILTDSACDLPLNMVEELNVEVLPLQVIIDNKSYNSSPDEKDITFKEFYTCLRQGKQMSTGQVNVSQFLESFESHLKQDKDVLYIAFSSALSGTCNSANIAAEELNQKYSNNKVIVVDSLAASMGQGLLVYHAALQKKNGLTIEELQQWLETNKLNLCHWFTVNDLFHLKKGGRINATSAIFGSMLGIKPILHVSDEGKLIPMGKVRGRQASIQELFKHMKEICISPETQTVFISHGDCEKEAEILKNLVISKLKVKNVIMNVIGPVIVNHSGPGTIALFFFGSKR